MKKSVRLAILVLAGVLTYFAAEKVSMAQPLCNPGCWDTGFGIWCCTTETCYDYCI